jgi:hypothetical protein
VTEPVDSPGATSHRARARRQLWLLAVPWVALAAACQPAVRSTALHAASAPQAETLVRAALDAAVSRLVMPGLCDTSGPGEARAAAAIGEVQSYSLDRVEPAWVGAEPYFRVDVTLHRTSGDEPRSVAVRAREGCVERLWGAPLPAAIKPEEGEVSL